MTHTREMAEVITNQYQRSWVTRLLLVLIVFTLFAVPLFPEWTLNRLYGFFFSSIFLSAAFALRGGQSRLFWLAVICVVVTAIGTIVAEGLFKTVARLLEFAFFVALVVLLIRQIAASRQVSGNLIIEAVVAYLLLGLAFGTMVLMANTLIQGAYTDPMVITLNQETYPDIRKTMYYAFTTFTTTGYGDIAPRHPLSMSLSILIGVSGQLYVAVILAILVGKFTSHQLRKSD